MINKNDIPSPKKLNKSWTTAYTTQNIIVSRILIAFKASKKNVAKKILFINETLLEKESQFKGNILIDYVLKYGTIDFIVTGSHWRYGRLKKEGKIIKLFYCDSTADRYVGENLKVFNNFANHIKQKTTYFLVYTNNCMLQLDSDYCATFALTGVNDLFDIESYLKPLGYQDLFDYLKANPDKKSKDIYSIDQNKFRSPKKCCPPSFFATKPILYYEITPCLLPLRLNKIKQSEYYVSKTKEIGKYGMSQELYLRINKTKIGSKEHLAKINKKNQTIKSYREENYHQNTKCPIIHNDIIVKKFNKNKKRVQEFLKTTPKEDILKMVEKSPIVIFNKNNKIQDISTQKINKYSSKPMIETNNNDLELKTEENQSIFKYI